MNDPTPLMNQIDPALPEGVDPNARVTLNGLRVEIRHNVNRGRDEEEQKKLDPCVAPKRLNVGFGEATYREHAIAIRAYLAGLAAEHIGDPYFRFVYPPERVVTILLRGKDAT